MEKLQLVSIVLELVMGIIATITAINRKKYMFGLAFTFFAYVVYDLGKSYSIGISNTYLTILFFLATLSALWSIWNIYKQNN